MTEVISVRFTGCGKAYFFEPNGVTAAVGDRIIVETANGMDIGEVSAGNHEVPDECIVPPLRPVIRLATENDLRIAAANKEREKQALVICKEKIAAHGLDMKLVNVEIGFEGSKILFFFTSDGRVDFRDLVKDLASVFRTRIELRQIGVRDETKMLGGLGICGRPYCCNQFLTDFEPVSTKMAKTQSLSLNPTKISGSCGRLMCCLRYEQDAYDELIKTIPKNGAFVETTGGYGNVVSSNVLRQTVKVRLDDGEEVKAFDADQVAAIPGGRPKIGEEPPHVLHYVEKKPEEAEPEEDPWKAPVLFAEEHELGVDEPDGSVKSSENRGTAGEARPQGQGQNRRPNNNQNRNRNRSRKPTQGGAQGGQPRTQQNGHGAKPQSENAQAGQNKPRAGGNQPRKQGGQPQNAQSQQPQAQGGQAQSAQPKKNNNNYRRRRPNKPKAEGGAAPQNKE